MLWIRLALRNALRNRRRTMLTAATVFLGTALLAVALAWITGVFGEVTRGQTEFGGHIRLVDTEFAKREDLMPLHENIADVEPLIAALRNVPGVVDVQPRILTGVAITVGEEIGDHFTLVLGATAEYYESHLEGPSNIVQGNWLTGADKEVVLGHKLARELGASVGASVLLLGQTQYGSMSPLGARVVGIVSSNAMVDRMAFVPLEEMRWLADMEGGALEVLVYGKSADIAKLRPTVEAVAALPEAKGLDVRGWFQMEPWASMMGMLGAIKGFIELLIIFIAALAIFNTMTMSVLERSGEIGVMRAMGLTRLGALGLFVTEAMVIGLIGGLAGATLGSAGGLYLEVHGFTFAEDVLDKMGAFPMKSTVHGDINVEIFVTAVAVGLVIAIVGAILPAFRAASIQPVSAMRARR